MAEKTDAIVTQLGGSMERPSFIPAGDTTGTDHITKEDIQMPRLALAQSLTPQVLEAKEGFNLGVIFNNLTEQIFGKGPIRFTILRADKPRWIEFNPRSEGGGVKDMDVPGTDPRTKFWFDAEGKKQNPKADKFYDFIIVMHPPDPVDPYGKIIGLSFKGTGLKIARQLNGLIKLRNAPIFAGLYDLSSIMAKNAKGTFALFQVKNAGFIPDQPTYELCSALAESLKDKDITISREGADVDNPDDDDVAPGHEPVEADLGATDVKM